MSMFTAKETDYLQAHRLGRLATTGKTGMPHVVPTGYHVDPDNGTIKIGLHSQEDRGQDRLYMRHIAVNPKAAFVVDDLVTQPTWTPTGISIKGDVVVHEEGGEGLGRGFGPRWVEIIPTLVSSWGIDRPPFSPVAPRKA